MKRIIVLMICMFGFVASVSAESWRVFDNACLFTQSEITEIEKAIFDFQRSTNNDFAVLTTDDYIGKENWKQIADSFYDSENFGFGHQASGMLYYIDMNQRTPYISTCGEMIDIFDSDTLASAHNACHCFLSSGQYKDAVLQMIEIAAEAVNEYNN